MPRPPARAAPRRSSTPPRSTPAPPEIPSQSTLIVAGQRVAAVDRRDRVGRRIGKTVDDQPLDVRLQIGQHRVELEHPAPGREVQLALGGARRARVQRHHAAGDARLHEERKADRDLEARPQLLGQLEVCEPQRPRPRRAVLSIAGAQRPAALARRIRSCARTGSAGGGDPRGPSSGRDRSARAAVGQRSARRRQSCDRRAGAPQPSHQLQRAACRDADRDVGVSRGGSHASAPPLRVPLAQQRHRLELQPLGVHRASRAGQEERASAARAGERAGRQLAVVAAGRRSRRTRSRRRAACRRRWPPRARSPPTSAPTM